MRSIRNMLKMALVVAAVTVATGQQSWASVGDFQYSTVVTPATPINPSSTIGGPGSQVVQTSAQASLSGVLSSTAIPTGTDIVVGNVQVSDLGTGSAYTDSYSQAISVAVTIKDFDSGLSKVFTFSGMLSGTVSSAGTIPLTVSAQFANPFSILSPLSISQMIGATTYTVSIDLTKDFAAPGAPVAGGSGTLGTYTFHVASSAVPEPASVALLGVGFLGAIGFVRRRRMV